MDVLNTSRFKKAFFNRYIDKGVPLTGTFELTARCNFDCKMCFVHTKPNAEFLKEEHDGDWWISLMEKACDRGMLFALLTGGECLLHPDFRRIYLFLQSRGVFIGINTNGFLLDENMVEFFKEHPPRRIQVTLYGTDDDSYARVTGVRAFDRIWDTILRLKQSGLNFRIAVTPNAYAPEVTEQIVKRLKDLGVAYRVAGGLITPTQEDEFGTLSQDTLDVQTEIAFLASQMNTAPVPIPFEELPPIGGGKTEEQLGIKCTSGRVKFYITHDGYMLPCASLFNARTLIKSAADFDKAWEATMEFANRFSMPRECEGCAYKKVCLPCPITRSSKENNGHCNPDVCERTRQLAAAGVKRLPMKDC